MTEDDRFRLVAAEIAATPQQLIDRALWPSLARIVSGRGSGSGWLVIVATIIFGRVCGRRCGFAGIELAFVTRKTGLDPNTVDDLVRQLEELDWALVRRPMPGYVEVTMPGILDFARAPSTGFPVRRYTPALMSTVTH